MTEVRKKSLTDLAEYLGLLYQHNNTVQLEEIVGREGISLYYDSYELAFDGMLVYADGCFHIHIDNDGGNGAGSKKGRFTLAHELAHYFIDEHRMGLKRNEFPPHGSRFDLNEKDPREIEADYFAGNLLLPAKLFRAFTTPRKFSIETIFQLSQYFDVSFLCTALRFCEIGNHSICIVFSKDNVVKWFRKSADFPEWAFRFKVGQALPPRTVAGDFYRNTHLKYTTIEDVNPDAWFYPRWNASSTLHEQCYYSKSYGYVISFIWFD
jgi:Zn-dependent peptidase ImmA (M78 family)